MSRRRKGYSNGQVVAVLLSFERFITGTYTLVGHLANGQPAVLDPIPGSLVEAYQVAMRDAAMRTPPPDAE